MKSWIENLWDRFRAGFWFFPTLLILGAIGLAIVVPEVDRQVVDSIPQWMKSTGETSRSTLAALASAMFTVSGVVFSVTVVTLSLTSSQFGPRLLRNFLEQNVTQVTMGSCLACCVYCLILLWRIDDVNDKWFVPHVAVFLATVLTLLALCLVVFFIHRVAYSVQSMNVVTDVAGELDAAIDRMFPKEYEASEELYRQHDDLLASFESHDGHSVHAQRDGYLQTVNIEHLTAVAKKHQAWVNLVCRPGDFIIEGLEVAQLRCDDDSDAEQLTKELASAFIVGNQRTPRQDVECAIQELTEIAVRALSPGINDPFTAIACIDRLCAVFCRLTRRDVRLVLPVDIDDDRPLRIVSPTTEFESILNSGFHQIRQHGSSYVSVSIRLLEALRQIASVTRRDADRTAIRRQADMTLEGCEKQDFCEGDLENIRDRHQAVTEWC